jgi:four helix bundle protein
MFASFEDLDVWKRSCQLSVLVYVSLRDCRDYGIRNQMQRASVSIASNIAEGAERSRKDFCRFLRIALGSAAELRTQAYIAAKIGIIDQPAMNAIVTETRGVAKMLFGLSTALRTPKKRPPENRKPKTENPEEP